MVSGVSVFVILVYLAVLVFVLIRRGNEISSPWLFLLRAFFPSWRFFDAPGYQPRLFVRAQLASDRWTEWVMFIPRATFKFADLFHNPENNLRMTEQTLIDHLSLDIQVLANPEDVKGLVSYLLVEKLACQFILRQIKGDQIKAYQFELRMLPGLQTDQADSTILVSPIINEMSHVS